MPHTSEITHVERAFSWRCTTVIANPSRGRRQDASTIFDQATALWTRRHPSAVVIEQTYSVSGPERHCEGPKVAVRWAHHKVTAIGDCHQVRVVCRDVFVATQPRDWGRERVYCNPVHNMALLERRPGADNFAAPLEEWNLPPCFGILRRKLEADWPMPGRKHRPKGYLNGTTRLIYALRLLEHATLGDLKAAVQKPLELETVTPEAVKVILEGQRDRPLAVFNLAGRPDFSPGSPSWS